MSFWRGTDLAKRGLTTTCKPSWTEELTIGIAYAVPDRAYSARMKAKRFDCKEHSYILNSLVLVPRRRDCRFLFQYAAHWVHFHFAIVESRLVCCSHPFAYSPCSDCKKIENSSHSICLLYTDYAIANRFDSKMQDSLGKGHVLHSAPSLSYDD